MADVVTPRVRLVVKSAAGVGVAQATGGAEAAFDPCTYVSRLP